MKRSEIRIASATKKLVQAQYRLKNAEKLAENRVRECREKALKPVYAARKASRDARAALTILELGNEGITPMKTIVRYRGRLYVFTMALHGWARIIPVKKDGRLYKDATFMDEPYNMRDVVVTDRVLVSE